MTNSRAEDFTREVCIIQLIFHTLPSTIRGVNGTRILVHWRRKRGGGGGGGGGAEPPYLGPCLLLLYFKKIDLA